MATPRPPAVLGPVHDGCTTPSRGRGYTSNGLRRWRCPDCGKVWTNEVPLVDRRKKDNPLSNAERSRRYQQRKRRQAD